MSVYLLKHTMRYITMMFFFFTVAIGLVRGIVHIYLFTHLFICLSIHLFLNLCMQFIYLSIYLFTHCLCINAPYLFICLFTHFIYVFVY